MKSNLKSFLPLCELILSLSQEERISYLKNISQPFIKFLTYLVYNLLLGSFEISPDEISKLKKYQKNLETLVNKKTSMKIRKKIWGKKNFFVTVIEIILPH